MDEALSIWLYEFVIVFGMGEVFTFDAKTVMY